MKKSNLIKGKKNAELIQEIDALINFLIQLDIKNKKWTNCINTKKIE